MQTSIVAQWPLRSTARLAGLAFLCAMAIVVLANYGVSFRLIVSGNAAQTGRNIASHEALFRLNILGNLVYALNAIVLLAALYRILAPVNRGLALAAAFCRLVYALMWAVTALNMLGALRLLGNAGYLGALAAGQLQAMAMLHLRAGYDAYYIGLPFWALASAMCCLLWFRSRYISAALAITGVIVSAWCAACAFAFIAIPHFDAILNASWYDTPLAVFELVLGFRLLLWDLRSVDG